MSTYADTSALVRLLVVNPQRAELVAELNDVSELVGCGLTVTELLRVAVAKHGVPEASVLALLDGLDVLALDPALLLRAGRLPSPRGTFLRSADAIHIAAAIELGVTDVLTYDRRQAQAAAQAGFSVRAPGLPTGWF